MPNPTYVRLDDNGLLFLLTLLKDEIDASGEENIIEVVKRNGIALTVDPTDKSVNVLVPTDNDIESLITAHGYQTAQEVDDAIADAIAGITGIEFEIVQALPQEGERELFIFLPIVVQVKIYMMNIYG